MQQVFKDLGRDERKTYLQDQYDSKKMSKEVLRSHVNAVKCVHMVSLTEEEYEEITGEPYVPRNIT